MTALCRPTWILLAVIALSGLSAATELETVYEWKYIDYEWLSEDQKQLAIDAGQYDSSKIIPVDFLKMPDGRVLVTTPKVDDNNPASLSIVSSESGSGGPLLAPYPSWDWHTDTSACEGIASVSRLFLDDCGRLWVVDSGKVENEQVCSAQILSFNATTDELIERVEIPTDLTHNSEDSSKGRLEVQFVETKGDTCADTWVYMADPEGYGMVIWDGVDMWRLENDDVYAPTSEGSSCTVADETFNYEHGASIFTIPPGGFIDEDYMLLRPLASFKDYGITTEDLHNSKSGDALSYYTGNITLTSQETSRVFSKSGVLLGHLASVSGIACWNVQNPLASEYIEVVLQDAEALQYCGAGRIYDGSEPGYEYEEYWMMSNRLQKYKLGTMDSDDVNYRILKINVASLVNGTLCEPASHEIVSIEDKFFFRD